MDVCLAVSNPGAADPGPVFVDDERWGVDFEWPKIHTHALLIEFVGPALCFRFRRDDKRIDILACSSRAAGPLIERSCRRQIGIVDAVEFDVEVICDDVSVSTPVVAGRLERLV